MAYRVTGAVVGAHTTAKQALALATSTGQRELVRQIVAQFPEIDQRTRAMRSLSSPPRSSGLAGNNGG